jgi:hypothetical protein
MIGGHHVNVVVCMCVYVQVQLGMLVCSVSGKMNVLARLRMCSHCSVRGRDEGFMGSGWLTRRF